MRLLKNKLVVIKLGSREVISSKWKIFFFSYVGTLPAQRRKSENHFRFAELDLNQFEASQVSPYVEIGQSVLMAKNMAMGWYFK